MSLSDAHHFRKMVAGACMIAAPILLLAAAIILPGLDDTAAGYLANAADSPNAWYLQALLGMAGSVLLVPAVLGLMHMLREREVAIGHIGGALALIGCMASVALGAYDLVVWQMTKLDQPVAMVRLLDRMQNEAGIAIPLYAGAFCLSLGLIVLSWGLFRAHVVHWEMAATIAAASVAIVVGYMGAWHGVVIAASVLLALGLGSVGLMVWRETDAEWEQTPELGAFPA
jgi:hypothetical protein